MENKPVIGSCTSRQEFNVQKKMFLNLEQWAHVLGTMAQLVHKIKIPRILTKPSWCLCPTLVESFQPYPQFLAEGCGLWLSLSSPRVLLSLFTNEPYTWDIQGPQKVPKRNCCNILQIVVVTILMVSSILSQIWSKSTLQAIQKGLL